MAQIEVPKTGRACVVKKRGEDFELELSYDYPVPEIKEDEILLKLSHTGICMSDVHNLLGDIGLPGKSDCVGHEGAGIVVALGSRVTGWNIGDRAGVKPCMFACQKCEPCKDTYEQNCEKVILSAWLRNGSYCQYIAHPADYATRIPHTYEELSDAVAGPLQCSGATTYRAVRESGVKIGQWLVVPGAGGGVGSLAVQYARAAGIRVIGIDTSEHKRKMCLEQLGCAAFIDFRTAKDIPAEVKKITGGRGAHAVMVTGGTPQAYANWWELVRVGGRLVVVGLPPKGTTTAGADPIIMVLNSLQVHGTRVGTLRDTTEALAIAAAGLVKPEVTVVPFEKFVETVHAVRAGKFAAKAAVRFDDE